MTETAHDEALKAVEAYEVTGLEKHEAAALAILGYNAFPGNKELLERLNETRRRYVEAGFASCRHDAAAVTNGMCECGEQVGPVTVTLALAGLPDTCPRCGAPAPDGQWGIGVHGNLLHVVCARCFTAITPVRAVAVT